MIGMCTCLSCSAVHVADAKVILASDFPARQDVPRRTTVIRNDSSRDLTRCTYDRVRVNEWELRQKVNCESQRRSFELNVPHSYTIAHSPMNGLDGTVGRSVEFQFFSNVNEHWDHRLWWSLRIRTVTVSEHFSIIWYCVIMCSR